MRRAIVTLPLLISSAGLACAPGIRNYNPAEVCAPAPPAGDVSPLLIEDAEDGDDQIVVQEERDGFVYKFVDGQSELIGGSTVPRRPLTPIVAGAQGSRCAWNLRGTLASARIVFAGLGMNMRHPKAAYDASAFGGIAFWARRSPGTTGRVRVHVPDRNTDPDGDVCTTECFNHFGAEVALDTEWKRFELPFGSLRQIPGWGAPRPPAIDPSALFGIQFQIHGRGTHYDVWIDDRAVTPATSANCRTGPESSCLESGAARYARTHEAAGSFSSGSA